MDKGNFTKEEATEQMKAGQKLTHTSFEDGEYVYMKGEDVYDENNYLLNNFWGYRNNIMYQTGWSVYDKE